jgi:hypothetical protein
VARAAAPPESERPKGFITPAEAAARAGVARATVYGWIRRGLLKEADVVQVRAPINPDVVLFVWVREAVVPKKPTKKRA